MLQKIKADNTKRIETGGLQVNDDWPGLFIRGDEAFALLGSLRFMLSIMEERIPKATVAIPYKLSYDNLNEIAQIIEKEVIQPYAKIAGLTAEQ